MSVVGNSTILRSEGVTGVSCPAVARIDLGGGVGIVEIISLANSTIPDVASTGVCGGSGARFLRIDFGCGGDVGGFGAATTFSIGFCFNEGDGDGDGEGEGEGDGEGDGEGVRVLVDSCESGVGELEIFTLSNVVSSSAVFNITGSR